MTNSKGGKAAKLRQRSNIVHAGLDPHAHHGFVNPPVYRGSTVLYPTYESLLESHTRPYTYGRRGTPTTTALETAIATLEGGRRSFLTSSGLAAINLTLLALTGQGDHILITDAVYQPTRKFADNMLARFGVQTTYYDPVIGGAIADLIRPETRLIFTESPGSQTFEMQDISAISAAARAAGIWHVTDNSWASPLYFKPFEHGVDISIQAATKYIVGHSDAMLGAVTVNERAEAFLVRAVDVTGMCAGSEEAYLGLRGFRTLDVRLRQHWRSGLEIARWLEARSEVARVIHPALESHPGHEIWRRDYLGAAGLFSVILKTGSKAGLAAMLDHLQLFAMGYSWGGFESLVIPFDPARYRTATPWRPEGPALRLHIGLEDVEDLKADLDAGLRRLVAAT